MGRRQQQWPCLVLGIGPLACRGWGVLGDGGAETFRKQEVLYLEKLKPRKRRGLAEATRGL